MNGTCNLELGAIVVARTLFRGLFSTPTSIHTFMKNMEPLPTPSVCVIGVRKGGAGGLHRNFTYEEAY